MHNRIASTMALFTRINTIKRIFFESPPSRRGSRNHLMLQDPIFIAKRKMNKAIHFIGELREDAIGEFFVEVGKLSALICNFDDVF